MQQDRAEAFRERVDIHVLGAAPGVGAALGLADALPVGGAIASPAEALRVVEYLRSFGLFGLWQLWQSSGPGGRVHFMIAEKSSDVKVKRVSRLAESKSRCCISHNFGGFYQIIPCIRPAVVRIKVAHGCPATIRIFILGRAVQSSRYLPLQPCSRLPDCCPLNEVGCSWILMTFAPGHRNSPTRSGTRLTRRSWMNLVRWSPCLLKTRTTDSWL